MILTQEVGRAVTFYCPRSPTKTSLHKLLATRFDHFETIYPERFSRSHGFYRPVISHVVCSYLLCGDLTQGGARVRCPDCHHEYLLAFSCRGRWFCPSCHTKKVVQFGGQLRGNILYSLPHRQYIFGIPIILRKLFLYNHKLLSTLCKAAADSLLIFLRNSYRVKGRYLRGGDDHSDFRRDKAHCWRLCPVAPAHPRHRSRRTLSAQRSFLGVCLRCR